MSIKGLGDLMKQAGELQEKMQALQDELARLEVTGESGAGLVRVTMTGRHEVRRVAIDPSVGETATAAGLEVLEDLIAAACNDAVRKLEAEQQRRMSGMAGAFGLPLGGLPRG
jgi:DNA-binding YbaB/EbfC family protein